jgi:hypothetical protein
MFKATKSVVKNAIFAPKPLFCPEFIDPRGQTLLKLREICWTLLQQF